MNFKKWTTALMLALAVSSCIQDEALNSEAAIDACTGADVQLAHINSDSKEINIYVHKGANLAKQQLLFGKVCPTVPPSRQTNIHRMTSLTITISATSLTPAPSPSLPKTANGPLPIP